MKISVLLASPDALDYNLIDVCRVLNTTFDELGEKLNFIKLDQKNIPPLSNQYPVSDVANIVNQLSNSDGVIFACTSNLFAPCSILQNFLDYLSLPMYRNFLENKNCFTLVVSNEYGEAETAQYLTSVIQHFGGFSPVVTAINKNLASQFSSNSEISEIFEKQVEDFYRILRQNRKYFKSHIQMQPEIQGYDTLEYNQKQNIQQNNQYIQNPMVQKSQQPFMQSQQNVQQNQNILYQEQTLKEHYAGVPNFDASQQIQEKLNISQASSLTNPAYIPEPLQPQQNNRNFKSIEKPDNSFLDNNNFNSQQLAVTEEPVIQPEHLFQQISNQQNHAIPQNQQIPQDFNTDYINNNIQQNTSTNAFETPSPVMQSQSVLQQILSLEGKFLPQNSNGLVTDIQFKVSGSENFDAFVKVNGIECRCYEGSSSTADVTIITNDDILSEILLGKVTTQKAFMTGQVKVRGNFTLLSKFDTLFKY